MISISGTTITMTRGDTLRLVVGIKNANGQTYTPAEGDVVRFALKHHYYDAQAAIKKTIPNDTLLLHLAPADTETLPAGEYVYDIELTYANGDIDTFISDKLVLVDEVD